MKIIENPDTEFAKEIRRELKGNNGFCPSAMSRDKDTKCMCRDFREQTEAGPCNCGLYIKVEDPVSDES